MDLPETVAEMTGRMEPAAESDGSQRKRGVRQHLLRSLHATPHDVLVRRFAHRMAKHAREVKLA